MTVGLSVHVDSAIAHLRERVFVHDAQVTHKALKKSKHRVVIELVVSPRPEREAEPDGMDWREKAEMAERIEEMFDEDEGFAKVKETP